MPKNLPNTNERPEEPDDDGIVGYLQFRGPQSSVTNDDFAIRFTTETVDGRVRHIPHPVVEKGATDAPANAIAKPVAEKLVERNAQICWGVCCEHVDADGNVCGDVFETPRQRNSHQSKHQKTEEQ